MKSYVCEAIRKVYFFIPRYNSIERHLPEGVLKADEEKWWALLTMRHNGAQPKISQQGNYILSHHTFHNIHKEEVLN